jgi:hypothetical protein
MKQLKWLVKDSNNQIISEGRTREQARDNKKFYEEHMFEEWLLGDVKFPVRIVREEWELIGEKVVR